MAEPGEHENRLTSGLRSRGRFGGVGKVARELKEHAPFTALGAATGVAVMVVLVLTQAPREASISVFHVLHPLHVVMSALATASMYRIHGKGRAWLAVVIGYTGAVGVATVSDAVAPFLAGELLGAEMEFHLPFIDADPSPLLGLPTWALVNACAAAGIAVAFWRPKTKLPHMGHTLLSTWASLFGLTAFATREADWLRLAPLVFIFLFLAVWLPCCVSDIAYPLVWTGGDGDGADDARNGTIRSPEGQVPSNGSYRSWKEPDLRAAHGRETPDAEGGSGETAASGEAAKRE